MANENEIVVRLNPNIMKHEHLFYATLEYYMENNDRQKDWKEVPGFVVGASEEEVQTKGNARLLVWTSGLCVGIERSPHQHKRKKHFL